MTPKPSSAIAEPFPSLASMRETHRKLMQALRENSEEEATLAEAVTFISRGQATGVILDTSKDQAAAQSLLDYWATTLYRASQEPPDAMLAEYDETKAPELADADYPYPGLQPFTEDQAEVFFGRKALLDEITGRLAEQRAALIVGPSGSGKSSLIMAGLLPALKAGA